MTRDSSRFPPTIDVVRPTTFIVPARLSTRLGIETVLASETFQHTGSFKFRAAYHVASNVPHRHIITASSGNFGQGLARACALLGKTCRVVMPSTSASVKIDAVREFGGEVDLIDLTRTTRAGRVQELAAEHGQAYVASPYDDHLVVEGNATLGAELARSAPMFDVVVAPVGGGGLLSGIIQGLRANGCQVPVYGAEPILANDAARSWRSGTLVANDKEPMTIADGVRTVSLGTWNWSILKDGLSGVIEVTEEQIRESVRLLFRLANLKAEPTAGLGIAALLAAPEVFRGRRVCCVVSGGNVDVDVYRAILGG